MYSFRVNLLSILRRDGKYLYVITFLFRLLLMIFLCKWNNYMCINYDDCRKRILLSLSMCVVSREDVNKRKTIDKCHETAIKVLITSSFTSYQNLLTSFSSQKHCFYPLLFVGNFMLTNFLLIWGSNILVFVACRPRKLISIKLICGKFIIILIILTSRFSVIIVQLYIDASIHFSLFKISVEIINELIFDHTPCSLRITNYKTINRINWKPKFFF